LARPLTICFWWHLVVFLFIRWAKLVKLYARLSW
jgi:hypothetical protein